MAPQQHPGSKESKNMTANKKHYNNNITVHNHDHSCINVILYCITICVT